MRVSYQSGDPSPLLPVSRLRSGRENVWATELAWCSNEGKYTPDFRKVNSNLHPVAYKQGTETTGPAKTSSKLKTHRSTEEGYYI
jgi:hypothetical protein